MLSCQDFEKAEAIVYRSMSPTPCYNWPILADTLGVDIFMKHENHTPIGAFKVRGGLVYANRHKARFPEGTGLISATRGNHGQSLAFAARVEGLSATIVVPKGNSAEKNDAMRAFGATVIEAGEDFDTAVEIAKQMAERDGLHMVPSFDEDLVAGVGTYSYEMLKQHPDLDTVYVPIGKGSGICGMIAARNALNLKTKIVGVNAARVDGYVRSFEAGHLCEADRSDTFADGLAVRVPDADALEIILKNAERVVGVEEDMVADAIRLIFRATHNGAEGAGAASLAALMTEKDKMAGKKVGVVLSGHNIDSDWMAQVLDGKTPTV
ncbi:threonine dehydratase [uncultured Cohaesibacter sp.]|uniref:threonine dehydratase n=1 Tax=uncultured Cohaesibacter sp. TaxID=1002546 RepID=UPI00292E3141|nr:threonine dehydratase [uncultured Cohaesibacter sp.]